MTDSERGLPVKPMGYIQPCSSELHSSVKHDTRATYCLFPPLVMPPVQSQNGLHRLQISGMSVGLGQELLELRHYEENWSMSLKLRKLVSKDVTVGQGANMHMGDPGD